VNPRILLALGLAACTPSLQDGFEQDLTDEGGCGDVVFYAHDDADTMMLTLYAAGLVSEATDAGVASDFDFTLPDGDVELIVEVGSKVSDATCDDVIENGGPRVRETWTATSGTASITILPGEDEWDAHGSLHLESVVFESESGATVTLPSFDIGTVAVGWLAG